MEVQPQLRDERLRMLQAVLAQHRLYDVIGWRALGSAVESPTIYLLIYGWIDYQSCFLMMTYVKSNALRCF